MAMFCRNQMALVQPGRRDLCDTALQLFWPGGSKLTARNNQDLPTNAEFDGEHTAVIQCWARSTHENSQRRIVFGLADDPS